MPAESLIRYQKYLLFLAVNRKRKWQTLASVDNSIIVLLFPCLVQKSRNYMRVPYTFAIMKQNIQQLMIEIFKRLKCICPLIMKEIFSLRNTPYTTRNLRDLDSRLPKTLNDHVKFAKHILEDCDSYKSNTQSQFTLFLFIIWSM